MKSSKVVALLRLVVAAAVLGSVAWQVSDRIVNNVFRPTEYFAFFSIQSSLIVGAVLLWSAHKAWWGLPETKLLVIARMSSTAYYILVSLAYNLLLRGSANDVRDGDYQWPVLPNEIIHVWGPIAVTLGWLLVQGEVRLRFRAALWVAVYPLFWLGFSVVRGIATGWWPYWFIDPTGDGGVSGMLSYIAAITVFLIGLGVLLLALARVTPIKSLLAKH